jgi:endonuclease/exonuclease/phosphatase family metal-dependent hydrolase
MTFFRILFTSLQLILITAMSAPLLVSEINPWWLDNLLSLQLQWTLLAVLSLLFGMRYFRRITTPLLPLYGLIVFGNFGDLYSPVEPATSSDFTFNIAQLNIRYENPHTTDIFSRLVQADYDIVVIQEISDHLVGHLDRLTASYPYSMGSTSPSGYSSGNVLLSKWPLSNRKIHNLGYAEGKIIDAQVKPAGSDKPVRVLALHPGAPRNRELWELRNSTLAFVAREVAESPQQHQVVVGDLNVSPWSPEFQTLLNDSGLRDSSSGYGYIPSWSLFTHNPISRLLSSAYIDHCLMSSTFAIRDKQWRFTDGSDHLLISTRLGVH